MAVDPDYVPDILDEVSADLNAAGMCYSFSDAQHFYLSEAVNKKDWTREIKA